MPTINAVTPDRQQYIATVRPENVAKEIKIMQNKGFLKIKVTK